LHKNCVIEAGINQIGEMSLLGKTISADVVIVTLIAPSHLEGLKNLETIASEKADLFLKSDQQTKVIFPEDCLVYKEFKKYYRESENVLVLRNGEPSKEFSEKESFYSIWTETNEIGSPLSLRLWRHGLPSISFPLPELSSGMVRNVALAVLAACESGVSVHEISERLPQFRPSALRGRCFQGRGRSYVLDCYNANPASMLDSIDFFRLRFSSYAKLFVLAGMDELGHDEKQLHNDLGKNISSDGNEIFLLIGEKASWISAGLLDCGVLEKQIIVLPKLNDAVSIVEDFEGAVLFKGSRSYGLEELLPTWAVEECPDGGQIAC
jgi:UDP-N-acetylmuramoyl-tripeptide--D-alanyl-D-alanine ligase